MRRWWRRRPSVSWPLAVGSDIRVTLRGPEGAIRVRLEVLPQRLDGQRAVTEHPVQCLASRRTVELEAVGQRRFSARLNLRGQGIVRKDHRGRALFILGE